MIDSSIAMVLVGAAVQALPPVRGIVMYIRRPAAARSSRPASMTGEPART